MGIPEVTSSPTKEELLPMNENGSETHKVKLKKELGLLEGVAIITGIIIGSGIFISPKGVIKSVKSVGCSIVIWSLCGLLSMVGALCYAELGTSIPKSGGDYAYLHEAFGPLPAFLYLWAANLIFVPTTNAIMGLTFAQYVIQPFFKDCPLPDEAVRMLAAVAICFLTFLNCVTVKYTTKLQDTFMFAKIGALVIIIIAGLVHLCMGNTENFTDAFEGTSTEPGEIAASFYSGIFSFAGWSYLNFMTEELKNPFVNLPRAIFISLPLVTLIYVLANVSYLSVLTPTDMIASDAIAVTFGNKLLGVMAFIMPLFVAMSALGGLCVHIMTSSRLCFVGAREGHFPNALSLINIKCMTPVPSLVFLCCLSLIMLSTSDIFALIDYSSIVETVFIMLSVCGLMWLRRTQPDMPRPIKVSLFFPVVFIMICLFLVIVPAYVRIAEVLIGLGIILTGVPFYFIGVVWKKKPLLIENGIGYMTDVTQKLFLGVKEE